MRVVHGSATYMGVNELVKFANENQSVTIMWVSLTYRQSKLAFDIILKKFKGTFRSHTKNLHDLFNELVNIQIIHPANNQLSGTEIEFKRDHNLGPNVRVFWEPQCPRGNNWCVISKVDVNPIYYLCVLSPHLERVTIQKKVIFGDPIPHKGSLALAARGVRHRREVKVRFL